MAQDWLADVRKWAPHADENVVNAIIRYCGIALQSRDASLVAMSDPAEREVVREKYLKKHLGLTDPDSVLDEGILAIGQHMKADRTKNRVTVYYLLAEHFGRLNIFGGAAGAAPLAAAGLGAVGAAGAAGIAAASGAADVASGLGEAGATGASGVAAAAGLGAAGLGAAGLGMAAAAAPESAPAPEPVAAAPAYAASSYEDEDTGGGMGWLKWLIGALILGALLFFLLRSCAGDRDAALVTDDKTVEAPAEEKMAAPEAEAEPAKTEEAAPVEEAAPAATPVGSGVVATTRDGKPMMKVYFDTAKSNVHPDFATAVAEIKDYVAKNPNAKLAVSGYNDPTGNAAANAALSKSRAQAVGKALETAGVPATAIELVKPAAATDAAAGNNAEARRVEVTVQ
jgi:outer membrane protein OmpA-like peptidoglycan-associated protein